MCDGVQGERTIKYSLSFHLNRMQFNIERLIKEYKHFSSKYHSEPMHRLRTAMKTLQREILTLLSPSSLCGAYSPNATGNDSPARRPVSKEEIDRLNDQYNKYKIVYCKMIDSYFPYTSTCLPQMMDLLHDDKFNEFDPEVYRDVLETYRARESGELTEQQVQSKIDVMKQGAIGGGQSPDSR